ncbi:TetR/AcrR family transcriptional regulator [Cryobacterium zhongshanensis]|uniref:TetR/AcrR family transcriptional regulator n=1 Tax=Cryobacterium zhongshanensis TaxID=2928153 RepID=A0AA41QV59_9MICO|nr:TetR/AcrR family transcriptional regulator [Cryobacterium zhongshanensis]MCI4658307.1 TetR/AcrR family transcriptional regulator [Cryobacterium zhongshanensis]
MTMTGKSRGSYAKTAGRRREILEASIEVFANHGFRNGSLREIAERVGMSQAGLLHHFSNKNELLAGVLELRDERSVALVPLDETPGIETIRGMVRAAEYNAEFAPGLVELHCVLSAEATAPEHPAHQYFVDRYTWVVSLMSEAFTNAQAAGQLREGVDPRSAAQSLIALSDGLQVQWLLAPDTLDMAEELRRYLRPLFTIDF